MVRLQDVDRVQILPDIGRPAVKVEIQLICIRMQEVEELWIAHRPSIVTVLQCVI